MAIATVMSVSVAVERSRVRRAMTASRTAPMTMATRYQILSAGTHGVT